MDQKQFTLESFKNIQQLIVFLHNKANAILVIDGVSATVFIGLSKDLTLVKDFSLLPMQLQFASIGLAISALVFVALFIYQLYFVIFEIIYPNLAKHYDESQISLFYFEHIAHLEKKDFQKRTFELDSDTIVEQLSGQVYEVARILTTKTVKLRTALGLVFSELVALVIFGLLSRLF